MAEAISCWLGEVLSLNAASSRISLTSDLLNDSEGMGIADLNADERNSLLTVRTEDGDVFEIVCRQATGKKDGWMTAN